MEFYHGSGYFWWVMVWCGGERKGRAGSNASYLLNLLFGPPDWSSFPSFSRPGKRRAHPTTESRIQAMILSSCSRTLDASHEGKGRGQ